MAKIFSESIKISFSVLRRNDEEGVRVISERRMEALAVTLSEVFSDDAGLVVEISKDE